MTNDRHAPWNRRQWLATNATALAAVSLLPARSYGATLPSYHTDTATLAQRVVRQSAAGDLSHWEMLARRAVEAAMAAGAVYADARITRETQQGYMFQHPFIGNEYEALGVGVRALVNGYWGFAAQPEPTEASVARLGRAAVAHATSSAKGPPNVVDLGHVPVIHGTWRTPVAIDPFALSIEEKYDILAHWYELSARSGLPIWTSPMGLRGPSTLAINRNEQVLVTSEGSHCQQTRYRVSARIHFTNKGDDPVVEGVAGSAIGWELFDRVKLVEQLQEMPARHAAFAAIGTKPFQIGRHTLLCDGATMAALADQTLGVTTQLDRALGYEANAAGTSFITDPLAMLGTFQVAAPSITLMANRSAPGQLGTVQWDDDAIVPPPFTIIKDGILNDLQTTREQAAWLAPYYHKKGLPIQSRGCSASADALLAPIAHTPNLSILPRTGSGSAGPTMDDLIGSIPNGLLLEQGQVTSDFQGKNGQLSGTRVREIKNGRLGRWIIGGAVLFNTAELWKKISGVGGETTVGQMNGMSTKGQPTQTTWHTTTAPAAIIPDQAVIDPAKS